MLGMPETMNGSRWLWLAKVLAMVLALAKPNLFAAEPGKRALLRANETIENATLARANATIATFRAEEKEREVPLEKLVRYGHFVDATRGPQILLADGSLLIANVREWDGAKLQVQSAAMGTLNLPLERVVGLLWQVPQSATSRDRLLRGINQFQGNQDVVWLPNGDRLSGTVGGLTGDQFVLEAESGKTNLPLSRVVAVALNPTLIDHPTAKSARFVLGLNDGSRLNLESLQVADNKCSVACLAGFTAEFGLSNVVAWQNLSGGVIFLSDLEPTKFQQVPLVQLGWPLGRDRSCAGELLRCSGRVYLKGLGMHAPAAAAYQLDREYRALCGEIGVDDHVGLQGSVGFHIDLATGAEGDQGGTWKSSFSSPIFRGHDPTKRFQIDLHGARAIRLRAEVADRGEERDFANWLDVRLEP
jgi:hypothetical protein